MAIKKIQKKKQPPVYPVSKKIRLKEFIRNPDLWWAVYFFAGFQIAVYLIGVAGMSENSFPWTLAGIAVGLIVSLQAIMMGSQRQAIKIRTSIVGRWEILKTVVLLFVFIYAFSLVLLTFGITMNVQPNQETVNLIMETQLIPMMFLTIWVAPLVEEIVFRELLPYAGGASMMSFVISSVLFAALHAPSGIAGWLLYGGISFAFLHLRLKGNNLMQSMAGHVVYNLTSTLFNFF